MQQSSSILLSLHPQHALKILSGEKKLEFRRVWATRPVSAIVIYATTPAQKIVGVARVRQVHQGSPTALWELAKRVGGGLSRRELFEYFRGKETGYAVELDSVTRFPSPLVASNFIERFRAPQSFSYIDGKTQEKLVTEMNRQAASGKVLFVAGVHGVGKTTLCENYAKSYDVSHRSASQLIREAKASALAARGKAVKDIAGNQQLLIDAVRQFRSAGKTLLLDGHFALLNAEHQPEALPTDVFSDLGINEIAVIHDHPRAISSRIATRDAHAMKPGEIAALQALELETAEAVAQRLCIPFSKIKSFDQSAFDGFMNVALAPVS